jgi:hypothetical protein
VQNARLQGMRCIIDPPFVERSARLPLAFARDRYSLRSQQFGDASHSLQRVGGVIEHRPTYRRSGTPASKTRQTKVAHGGGASSRPVVALERPGALAPGTRADPSTGTGHAIAAAMASCRMLSPTSLVRGSSGSAPW